MTCMSDFWFTSFQTFGINNMLPNKQKLISGYIGNIFPLTRHDVSQLRHLALETNQHIYGHKRNILSEFSMKELICIYDKTNLCDDAIFEISLMTYCSKSTLKGYQQTFPDFIGSLKKIESESGCCDLLDVDIDMPEVDQVQYMVK